jgi:circadian clock protein KaiB
MTSPSDVPPASDGHRCYGLTLFVSGASDLSARAIDDVRNLCDLHLNERFDLTVIDIHAEPEAALDSRVSVVPTLVKTSPLPVCRVVGDLSNAERVLSALLVEHVDDGARV